MGSRKSSILPRHVPKLPPYSIGTKNHHKHLLYNFKCFSRIPTYGTSLPSSMTMTKEANLWEVVHTLPPYKTFTYSKVVVALVVPLGGYGGRGKQRKWEGGPWRARNPIGLLYHFKRHIRLKGANRVTIPSPPRASIIIMET